MLAYTHSVYYEISNAGLKLKKDDKSFKKRAALWEKIFKDNPPTIHHLKSRTWANTRLHKKSPKRIRDEL
jgi:hypothetical protein